MKRKKVTYTRIKIQLTYEPLLPEESFVNFCNEDDANKYSGKRWMSIDLLRAAKEDGLIVPFETKLTQLHNLAGGFEEKIVDHYSPLQIFLAYGFRNNIVVNGKLYDPTHLNWYPEKPKEEQPQYIAWGTTSAFGARPKDDPKRLIDDGFILNVYAFADLYHRCISFLRELPHKHRYDTPDEERELLANPVLLRRAIPSKNSIRALLKKHKLTVNDFEKIRKFVASTTLVFDPLEQWHYYVHRHPGIRKCQLKGEAGIAQTCYKIYDILTEVWEKATGKKSLPLIELTHGALGSDYKTPRVKHMDGIDVVTLEESCRQFELWAKKKENKPFVTQEILAAFEHNKAEIADYRIRYGDRSHAGSTRIVTDDEVITYEQLDAGAKQFYDQLRPQTDQSNSSLIKWAIENRLDDTRRSLQATYRAVEQQLMHLSDKAWHAYQNMSHSFYMKHADLPILERNTLYAKMHDEQKKIAEQWDKRKAMFRSIGAVTHIVYCRQCRKKPIQLHLEQYRMGHGDYPSMCDSCAEEKRHDPEIVKNAEWRCRKCNVPIYKFGHGNTVAVRTIGKSLVTFQLMYGQMKIEAACSKCGLKQDKVTEWGWLP